MVAAATSTTHHRSVTTTGKMVPRNLHRRRLPRLHPNVTRKAVDATEIAIGTASVKVVIAAETEIAVNDVIAIGNVVSKTYFFNYLSKKSLCRTLLEKQ